MECCQLALSSQYCTPSIVSIDPHGGSSWGPRRWDGCDLPYRPPARPLVSRRVLLQLCRGESLGTVRDIPFMFPSWVLSATRNFNYPQLLLPTISATHSFLTRSTHAFIPSYKYLHRCSTDNKGDRGLRILNRQKATTGDISVPGVCRRNHCTHLGYLNANLGPK